MHKCLVDLVDQSHRPLEILVVDQSDVVPREIRELVDAHDDLVSYHQVTFRGLPEARNYGWQHARHDAVVFVDDDIECGPEFVAEHLATLKKPGVGLVAGGIDEPNNPDDVGPPTGTFNWWTATAIAGFAAQGQQGDLDHVKGCNWSASKKTLRDVGGIDEALNVGAALYEELEFCLRARRRGYRIEFNGQARLTHLAAPSGGCRVDQVRPYVRSMTHNRGVVIQRHLRWYQRPVALGRVLLTAASYARTYRQPAAVLDWAVGSLEGLRTGARGPRCTTYAQEHRR